LFILAENIRVFARHGGDRETPPPAREHLVQVRIATDFSRASGHDELQGTVDYATVHRLVDMHMRVPSRTLEHACGRILASLKDTRPEIASATVRIEVPAPPLRAAVGKAFVEMDLEGKTRVGLEDARFFALHGLYEGEETVGNRYSLDCSAVLNKCAAAESDNIADTLNYEHIFTVLAHEMSVRAQLIERVASRIRENLIGQFPAMDGLSLRIGKIQPPVQGQLGRASVLLEADFCKECPRCKKTISCKGNPLNCPCKESKMTAFTAGFVREQYGGCVCGECRSFYER
jgi:dihydroneopterin aldolase